MNAEYLLRLSSQVKRFKERANKAHHHHHHHHHLYLINLLAAIETAYYLLLLLQFGTKRCTVENPNALDVIYIYSQSRDSDASEEEHLINYLSLSFITATRYTSPSTTNNKQTNKQTKR